MSNPDDSSNFDELDIGNMFDDDNILEIAPLEQEKKPVIVLPPKPKPPPKK